MDRTVRILIVVLISYIALGLLVGLGIKGDLLSGA
jgi:hypothetical protein